jgi:hypothetical protein
MKNTMMYLCTGKKGCVTKDKGTYKKEGTEGELADKMKKLWKEVRKEERKKGRMGKGRNFRNIYRKKYTKTVRTLKAGAKILGKY